MPRRLRNSYVQFDGCERSVGKIISVALRFAFILVPDSYNVIVSVILVEHWPRFLVDLSVGP